MKRLTNKKFYALLEREREARGMDNKTLCKYLGITQATISRWKNGKADVSITRYFGILGKLKYDLNNEGVPVKRTGTK